MNKIMAEELWRGIAVFFITLFFMSILITGRLIPASFFSLIGIPLIVVVLHFIVKIYIRRNEVYKPKKWSLKVLIRILAAICLFEIIIAFMSFTTYGKISTSFIVWFAIWFILLLISIILYLLRKNK
ncbi:MAG: hypothetical protein KAK00_07640 [Nanoarchaeota archaeon]|nr:hypothetical protein [Nanoarchaeota archaeon]